MQDETSIRDAIVKAAYSCIGTRYQHRQANGPLGVDCIGLVIWCYAQAGVIDQATLKIPHYSTQWHMHNGQELLYETAIKLGCVEKPVQDTQPGDFLMFKFGKVNSHVGIWTGKTLIHAVVLYPRKVTEVRLNLTNDLALSTCFNPPGLGVPNE